LEWIWLIITKSTPNDEEPNQIGIFTKLERYFGSLRKSKKGLPLSELFKQVLCFMFDSTSRHVSHFDQLAADHGYGAAIETDPAQLASSHQIKRMFGSFIPIHVLVFRRLLAQVFIRRLVENGGQISILDTCQGR
jgi:hypothetical protein